MSEGLDLPRLGRGVLLDAAARLARFDAADWEAVEALAPRADDPLFGTPDPQRFRALYRHLFEQAQV